MKTYTFYENSISAGLPVVFAELDSGNNPRDAVMLGTGDLRLSVFLDKRLPPDIINGKVYDAEVWEDEGGRVRPMGVASVVLVKPEGLSPDVMLKVVGLGYAEWIFSGAKTVAAMISRHTDFSFFTDALVRMKPGDALKLEREDGSQTIVSFLQDKLEIQTIESPRANPYANGFGDSDGDGSRA